MSSLTKTERDALPDSDFAEPRRRLLICLDTDDLATIAKILASPRRLFSDPAAVRARAVAIAHRKGLRLPPELVAFGGNMSRYTAAELKNMASTEFADVINRKWPVKTQEDLDRCLRECPEAKELGSPIRAQLNRLAVRFNLKLPSDVSFARTSADLAAWNAEARDHATAFARDRNRLTRGQTAEPAAEPDSVVTFANDGSAEADRARVLAFAQRVNRRQRGGAVPEVEAELATFAADDEDAARAKGERLAAAENRRLRRAAPQRA